MRPIIQKIFSYEGFIDDLLRQYALKKASMSLPEQIDLINSINRTEATIFRLKQSLPKVLRKEPK